MPTDRNAVRQWVQALGSLTAGSLSEKEASARVQAMVPLLAEEFSTAHFTASSLGFVAKGSTFFPAYGEVCKALNAWANDNLRPARLELVHSAPAARSEASSEADDRAWWQERVDRVAEIQNPTARWRELMGVLSSLTRPASAPRPTLVARLDRMAADAAAQGADTDPSKVRRSNGAFAYVGIRRTA